MKALVEYVILPSKAADHFSKGICLTKFYLIDPYGNYVFLDTDKLEEAVAHSKMWYHGAPVKACLTAHNRTNNERT